MGVDGPAAMDRVWRIITTESFISDVGPYMQRFAGELIEYGFIAEARHLNPVGVIHGGCLITFLETCMGWETMRHAGSDSVTIQFDTHFLKSVRAGDLVICRAANPGHAQCRLHARHLVRKRRHRDYWTGCLEKSEAGVN